MMRPSQESSYDVTPEYLNEVKINLFKAAENKDELTPLIGKLTSNATSASAMAKALTQLNDQRKTLLHVAAEYQDADTFIKLLKIATKYKLLDSILLMQDENNRNLLHLIADFQIQPKVKRENKFYPLNEVTRLVYIGNLIPALFAKDIVGQSALSIIARKQEDRLDYIMEFAINFDLKKFHVALFNDYPDGKIPVIILNRYLLILIESQWLNVAYQIWDDFFERVDKDSLKDALLLPDKIDYSTIHEKIVEKNLDYDNEYHKKLLAYLPREITESYLEKQDETDETKPESNEVENFKRSIAELVVELDKFPRYRNNWLGFIFSVQAVNYDAKQALKRYIISQLRELTIATLPIIKNNIYNALINFRNTVIKSKGTNESRYLAQLDAFINAANHVDIKTGMRLS